MDVVNKILNSETIKNPWQHKIIDNFLPEDILISIKQQINIFYTEKENKKAKVIMMDEALNLGISSCVVEKIVDFSDNLIKNIQVIVSDHETNNFEKGTYFIFPKFGLTGNNFVHKIHDENPFKVLNIVTYIYPEIATGTILYKKNDINSFAKEIPWKENRAFLTYPVQGKSWHNWLHINSDEPRLTLNLFFEKIEGFKNSLHNKQKKENFNNILWMYEQFGKEKLVITI
jgi:hypothetical protein